MSTIPEQPLGKDLCANCGAIIHLSNRALEAVWVHPDGYEWCPPIKAVPASRPWPEGAV